MEEALGTYPVIMSLIRDRAKTLWAKHNAENSQKLTKSVSQQQKEVRLSMVPHKTSTTAITADIHRELHGEDQNHLDDFQEESDETFLSKMEVRSRTTFTCCELWNQSTCYLCFLVLPVLFLQHLLLLWKPVLLISDLTNL